MPPKINPQIKIDLKDGAFAMTDLDTNETSPIDPLAVFICSLCDGSRDISQITSALQQNLTSAGLPAPDTTELQKNVQEIINTLSEKGVVFLE